MKIEDFEKAVQEVCPNKSEKVITRFKFDYGCVTFGLTKKKIKETLFYVNHIFKLGKNEDYIPENYQYRLTSEEINQILNKL